MSKPKTPKESPEQRKTRLEAEGRLAAQEASAAANDLLARKRFVSSRARLAMRIFGTRAALTAANFAATGGSPGGGGGLGGLGGLSGMGGFGGFGGGGGFGGSGGLGVLGTIGGGWFPPAIPDLDRPGGGEGV